MQSSRKRKKVIKDSISQFTEALEQMTPQQIRRLHLLAKAVFSKKVLYEVIAECPLNETESKLYAQLSASVTVASIVRAITWAKMKGQQQ